MEAMQGLNTVNVRVDAIRNLINLDMQSLTGVTNYLLIINDYLLDRLIEPQTLKRYLRQVQEKLAERLYVKHSGSDFWFYYS